MYMFVSSLYKIFHSLSRKPLKLTFRFGTFPLWQRQDSKCRSNERKRSSLYDGEPVGIKTFQSGKNVAKFNYVLLIINVINEMYENSLEILFVNINLCVVSKYSASRYCISRFLIGRQTRLTADDRGCRSDC